MALKRDTILGNGYNTAEECKFGDKRHFAYGEWELGKSTALVRVDTRTAQPLSGRFGGKNAVYPSGI